MTTLNADAAKSTDLIEWIVTRGLEGAAKEELLDGYCNKLLELGVPLMRFHAAQSALHPVYGGTGFSWYQGRGGESPRPLNIPKNPARSGDKAPSTPF